jgi:Ni,Fe-hydrogenase I large subunit
MPETGEPSVRVNWDGRVVLGAEIESSRPKAYRMLKGRIPDNVAQLVPLLYGVCGKAQQAAAIAATSAAQGHKMPRAGLIERGVVCEAMQEHLWRLLLDWPKLLGLPQQQQQFVHWHGVLNAVAKGQAAPGKLLAELCRILLGVTVAEWRRIDTYAGLSECWLSGGGLLAPVLAALDAMESGLDFAAAPAVCAILPTWSAAEAWENCAGRLGHEFVAMPQYGLEPAETGALAHHWQRPLLQDALRARAHRLMARVIARLADLLDSVEALAQENMGGRVQAVLAPDATGLSVVRTARGMLMHYVKIEEGRVAEYLISAPTEWNFHPQGALASGLTGLKENDEEQLMQTVNAFVLSLDPCVKYEIAHA